MLPNRSVVQNLNTSIDEDLIKESVNGLRERVKHIESFSGPSLRTKKLRDEIMRLEKKLSCNQEQTSPIIDIHLDTV